MISFFLAIKRRYSELYASTPGLRLLHQFIPKAGLGFELTLAQI